MAVFTKGIVPWNSLDDNTRLPLTSELESGYPCGQADQQLFNFTAGYSWGQVHNVIVSAGLTVDRSNLLQLGSALQTLPAASMALSRREALLFGMPSSVTRSVTVTSWRVLEKQRSTSTADDRMDIAADPYSSI